MGANYLFYVKTIATHARAFFKVIIFSISSVQGIHMIVFGKGQKISKATILAFNSSKMAQHTN